MYWVAGPNDHECNAWCRRPVHVKRCWVRLESAREENYQEIATSLGAFRDVNVTVIGRAELPERADGKVCLVIEVRPREVPA